MEESLKKQVFLSFDEYSDCNDEEF